MGKRVQLVLRPQKFVPMRVYLGVDDTELDALRQARRRVHMLRLPVQKRRLAAAYRLLLR
ncbi:MAG: hypothetical protein KJ065_24475 [Anaerolineae bacterium]|nr:hypothetical protein [Anaerolineae bacterium]